MFKLKSIKNILVLIILFNIVSVMGLEHPETCNGVNVKLSEDEFSHLQECSKVVGIESHKDLEFEQVPCFSKCVFEQKKIIDEKGEAHKESIVNMFSPTLPNEIKEALTKAMERCIDVYRGRHEENQDHHRNVMDTVGSFVSTGDESCAPFGPLAVCFHDAYSHVCDFK